MLPSKIAKGAAELELGSSRHTREASRSKETGDSSNVCRDLATFLVQPQLRLPHPSRFSKAAYHDLCDELLT